MSNTNQSKQHVRDPQHNAIGIGKNQNNAKTTRNQSRQYSGKPTEVIDLTLRSPSPHYEEGVRRSAVLESTNLVSKARENAPLGPANPHSTIFENRQEILRSTHFPLYQAGLRVRQTSRALEYQYAHGGQVGAPFEAPSNGADTRQPSYGAHNASSHEVQQALEPLHSPRLHEDENDVRLHMSLKQRDSPDARMSRAQEASEARNTPEKTLDQQFDETDESYSVEPLPQGVLENKLQQTKDNQKAKNYYWAKQEAKRQGILRKMADRGMADPEIQAREAREAREKLEEREEREARRARIADEKLEEKEARRARIAALRAHETAGRKAQSLYKIGMIISVGSLDGKGVFELPTWIKPSLASDANLKCEPLGPGTYLVMAVQPRQCIVLPLENLSADEKEDGTKNGEFVSVIDGRLLEEKTKGQVDWLEQELAKSDCLIVVANMNPRASSLPEGLTCNMTRFRKHDCTTQVHHIGNIGMDGMEPLEELFQKYVMGQ